MNYGYASRTSTSSNVALIMVAMILGSFGVGTGEFAIMGLVPNVAQNVGISITQAGNLISAYALGVVIGTPLSVLLIAKFSRKSQLLMLIGWAVLGNLASSAAGNYDQLLLARFASGLPHGAYFGVASLVAASMVSASERGKAVGWIMLGITTATLVGNPVSTLVGQAVGWRWVFAIISGVELAAALLIAAFLRDTGREAASSPWNELGALANRQVWLTLGVGAIGFGGVFSVISYVAPALAGTSHLNATWVPYVLFAFGLGMMLGNAIGGRAADRNLLLTIAGALAWSCVVMLLYTVLMHQVYTAFLGVFLVGTNMALVAPLQVRLMDVAGDAQTLAASLNHSALNLANAIGPWLGGIAIDRGLGWASTGYVGALLSIGGGVIFMISAASGGRARASRT